MVNTLKTKKFNCAPRLGDEIKIPKRTEVLSIMKDLEPEVLNVLFPIEDLIDTLGEFLALRFKVDVVAAQADQVDMDDININAYYDPDMDERKKIAIELVLVTNPNCHYITFDSTTWLSFCYNVADCLAHELIHMKQFRSRDFEDVAVRHASAFNEVTDTQGYFSDPDEIEAYAFNIAQELKEHKDPFLKLQDLKKISSKDSINLWAYIKTFNDDLEHPTIKKLIKKVYKHLKSRK